MPPKRALLDVDSTILERNLNILGTYDDPLQQLFPAPKEDIPSKLVKPTPGFCVKSRTTNNDKLFVNICQTDAIPAPEDISEAQLLEILQSDTPSTFRVPMSIGDARPEVDKSGQPATAYDVAINPVFFAKVEMNKLFKQFFLTVVFEGLQDKYSITINVDDFTVLKNRKAMGTLQLHRIQQREVNRKMNTEKKLIEELDVPTTSLMKMGAGTSKVHSLEEPGREPAYRLVKINTTNDGDQFLVADLFMPDVTNVAHLTLDITDDRIILESRHPAYLFDIFLPCSINQAAVAAQMNKSLGIITITMPVV
ncbi:PIH1 domain containing 1 [Carabus blaptoides fortunei]